MPISPRSARRLAVLAGSLALLTEAPAWAQDQGPVTRRGEVEAAGALQSAAPRALGADPFAALRSPDSAAFKAWSAEQKTERDTWLSADHSYPDLLARAQALEDKLPRPAALVASRLYLRSRQGWRSVPAADPASDKSSRPEFGPEVDRVVCEARGQAACLLRGPGDRLLDYAPADGRTKPSDFHLPAGAAAFDFEDADTLLAADASGAVRRLKRGAPWQSGVVVFQGAPGETVEPQVFWTGQGARLETLTARSAAETRLFVFSQGEFRRFHAPAGSVIAGVTGDKLIVHLAQGWRAEDGGADVPAGGVLAFDAGQLLNRAPELTPQAVVSFQAQPDVQRVAAAAAGVLIVSHDRGTDTLFLCNPALRGWGVRRIQGAFFGLLEIAAIDRSGSRALVRWRDGLQRHGAVLVDLGSGVVQAVEAPAPDFPGEDGAGATHSVTAIDGAKIRYAVIGPDAAPILALPRPRAAEEIDQLRLIGSLWLDAGGRLLLTPERDGPGLNRTAQQLVLMDYEDMASAVRDAKQHDLIVEGRIAVAGAGWSGLIAGIDLVKHPTYWGAGALVDALLDPQRIAASAQARPWLNAVLASADDRILWGRIAPYDSLLSSAHYAPTLLVTTPDAPAQIASDGPRFTARLNAAGGQGLGVQALTQAEAVALTVGFLRRVIAR